MAQHADTARAFIDTFNGRDMAAFGATLHPDVEIHSNRGTRRGIEEARAWATRVREGVQQRIIVESISERADLVLATIVREWWWEHSEEEHEFAHRDEMAWLFHFEDGLIREWRPFEDRAEAEANFASG
jgi:ketosteroid isomerase-like protein